MTLLSSASFGQEDTAEQKIAKLESRVESLEKLERRVQLLEKSLKVIRSRQRDEISENRVKTQKTATGKSPLLLDDWSFSHGTGTIGNHYYTINLHLRNTGTKGIKLIEGGVFFNDLLDKKVYGIKIPPDIVIPPGSTVIKTAQFPINQFSPADTRMAGMQKTDIKANLAVLRVVFDDNSVQKVSK